MSLGIMSPKGPFKQAERLPTDGPCPVRIVVDPADGVEKLEIECAGRSVVLSEFNAARVFGCMAMMLGIRLPKELGKAINLGDFSARIG